MIIEPFLDTGDYLIHCAFCDYHFRIEKERLLRLLPGGRLNFYCDKCQSKGEDLKAAILGL
jgi:hypothetical protein